MLNIECLPILVVSACDNSRATKIVSDVVQQDISQNNTESGEYCTWNIENKYYNAKVSIHALLDEQTPPLHLTPTVEAHLIYLEADEGKEVAERRLHLSWDLVANAQVRLILKDGSESEALVDWALRHHYELVTFASPTEDFDDEEEDSYGYQRVRSALHAHTWHGLVRIDGLDLPASITNGNSENDVISSDSDESCNSWGSWEQWSGEREATFANMLGSLQTDRNALNSLADNERRRQAELLLKAFRSALRPSESSDPNNT
ncbi:unnamed protein product [Leptosia nina]|uniref:Uncharacterized protein n=1 Tax=Leptosia nina TaxID=320188 RepID=A0AAV1J6S7_9NEOP